MNVGQPLLVRLFEKTTGTHAAERTASAVLRFGPYLTGMVLAKALSTAGQLLVGRWLGPSEFGHFAVVISASTLIASPLAGAWGATFVRYAAGQAEATWLPLLRWTALRVLLSTAATTAAVAALASILAPALRIPVGLLLCGSFLATAMALWLFAKAACQGREDWARFVTTEVGFGAIILLLAGVLLLLPEPRWWQAVLILLAAYVGGSAPAWPVLWKARTLPPRPAGHAPAANAGGAKAEYARFALLTGAANTILQYGDRFAAQGVLGFTEVGIYHVYNFATVGVAMLLSTMLYNFVFPLFPQGNRRVFAALFRRGFVRLLPLLLAGLYLVGMAQIWLTEFPFRSALLAVATLNAVSLVVSGFYAHLVASIGVHGVRLSAKVAMVTLAAFAVGAVPAVRIGGLEGLFLLYTLMNVSVAIFYDQLLRRLPPDAAPAPSTG